MSSGYFTSRERLPAALLASSYLFGTFMLGHQVIEGFVFLTSLHLLFSATLIAFTHRPKPMGNWWIWAAACAILGYWVEYLGVHYGWLFGSYSYGDVLGPQLWDIPLVIGINWVLVVYAVCASLNMLARSWSRWLKAATGALLLVALDVLIEPVAIALGFWTWELGQPPLQNFIGWFGAGLLQTCLFYLIIPYTENRLAPLLLILQLVFFSYLCLLL